MALAVSVILKMASHCKDGNTRLNDGNTRLKDLELIPKIANFNTDVIEAGNSKSSYVVYRASWPRIRHCK